LSSVGGLCVDTTAEDDDVVDPVPAGPSTTNEGLPFVQAARTSTFWEPFLNSIWPGLVESSVDQPAAGTPARTAAPPVQWA
jgi:hypothetical protein